MALHIQNPSVTTSVVPELSTTEGDIFLGDTLS